jgi:hypothetical protein
MPAGESQPKRESLVVRFSGEKRPGTLAGDYLGEALEALELAGNARGIYPGWALDSLPDHLKGEQLDQARGAAAEERVKLSRRAILYSAFAAEAFINEFMAMYFEGRDLETLDRLPTLDKYILAPRFAVGLDLFRRGGEPTQTLQQLFRQRDALVHPKPGKALPLPKTTRADPVFNPHTAATFLVRTAEAADALLEHARIGDRFNLLVSGIATAGPSLVEFGSRATEKLVDPDKPYEYATLELRQDRLPDFADAKSARPGEPHGLPESP